MAGIRHDGGASHLSPIKMQDSSEHAQRHYRCSVGLLQNYWLGLQHLNFAEMPQRAMKLSGGEGEEKI